MAEDANRRVTIGGTGLRGDAPGSGHGRDRRSVPGGHRRAGRGPGGSRLGAAACATSIPLRCTATATPSDALGRRCANGRARVHASRTKVGRLLVPVDQVPGCADIDRQSADGVDDAYYAETPPVRVVFDYSYDGVLRSVEESLDASRPRPRRHPLHPRPRRPLGGGHRRRLSGAGAAARRGRGAGHRRGHEPGSDARPLRARGRLRRLHGRRAVHAPRPVRRWTSCCRCARRRASRSWPSAS